MPSTHATSRNKAPANDDRLPDSLRPISHDEFGEAEARHLLLRAGFGGTPQQIRTLAEWGPQRAVDFLLGASAKADEHPSSDEFDKDIMRPATAEEREAYRRAQRARDEDALARFRAQRQDRQRRDRDQMRDIQRWWLARMIQTPSPLVEKMTLFWHGHFATSYRTIEDSYHMFRQNQLFRAHALGSYADLMRGVIRDPAMLAYLDNNDSRKDRPNENLARELMELFSLGVGNYAEADIKEGARALTGYTFDDDDFAFHKNNHDDGFKSVLGARGNLDGDGFVDAILATPACAEFIAAKVYDFFAAHASTVPEDHRRPTARVVQRLADVLRREDYRIAPVLRELFLSAHFYHPALVGARIKSPAELVVGAVRSLNVPVRDLSVLAQGMDLMGQSLFFPPSVKGWDGGRTWINTATLYTRQNLLNYMITGTLPSGYAGNAAAGAYDPLPLLDPLATQGPARAKDPGAVVTHLLSLTLGAWPEHAIDALVAYARARGNAIDRDTVAGMLVLVTAMPEYQLC